ncbi:ring-cleaving dioxygenase [Robertmurraya massiliosenegalensis]|uniref:ring-cleaving dioxygenase n=1 Tax=Robertmurraya TaxID=2837507 RepID=UPI0039A7368E
MLKSIGIHHITAMVNDAQRNIDFYTDVLGLRLVKRTVNFERPEVYHLYFGDYSGQPGTIITFFPWEKQLKGRIGTGQVGVTSYVIPKDSMPFWKNRLQQFGFEYETSIRFGEKILSFTDPDGLELELIERQVESSDHEVMGFAGATLFSAQPNKTAEILENLFGMKCVGDENGFLRFKAEASVGNSIDIKLTPSVRGLMGAGTVHHIAFRAKDEKELFQWRELLLDKGYNPTEVRDRNYFKSIYFQDEGGILFEIATDIPGFTVDESIEHLGEGLMLPPWLETKREALEDQLPKVEVRIVEGNQS